MGENKDEPIDSKRPNTIPTPPHPKQAAIITGADRQRKQKVPFYAEFCGAAHRF